MSSFTENPDTRVKVTGFSRPHGLNFLGAGVAVVENTAANTFEITIGGGGGGGGGGAPAGAQYLTLAADVTLTDERVLTAGTNIAIVDAGPGLAATLNVPSATEAVKGAVELATSAEVTAGLAVQASDTRLSNARTPTAHAATHAAAGGDVLHIDTIGAGSDIATNNASITRHGLLKKLSNTATEYMDGAGNWSTPAGGATGAPAGATYVTLGTDLALTDERVLTEGTNIDFVDAGAGSTLTVNVPDASTTVKGAAELATDGEAIAGVAVQGNDARLSNARAPTAHAVSHRSGGTDAIKLDELAATTDVATLNSSTTAHGLLKKLSNTDTQFMNGAGNWVAVQDASTTVKGIVELATSAEVTAGLAVQASDTRLGDARAPTAHAATHLSNGSDPVAAATTTVRGTAELATDGENIAGVVVQGNDARLSDARAPTAHAVSHRSGGGDAIKLDELAAPTDVATLNSSTTAHGLLKKLSNVSTEYMNGSGNWATPPDTTGASYITLAADGTLTSERVLTQGTNITFADAGAGSTLTINVPDASETVRGAAELATSVEVTAGLVVQANDTRLSNARAPTAHAVSHRSGGTDAIKLDELAAPTDVATLNASTTAHGLLKKLSNTATEYMNGAGNWSTPSDTTGAPPTASYITLATDITLTSERVLTQGTNLSFADAGAGSTLTINSPDASTTVKGAVELATDGEVAAGVAVQGDDARLSNSRAPTAHAFTHNLAGGDPVHIDTIGAGTDITTNNASTTKHGLLKKLDNTATNFMDGTGAWSVPAGTGAPVGAQYVTLAADAALTVERVLTQGTNISFADAGAGSTLTVNVPSASETVKGAVELATSLETDAGLAVQASDTRLSNARAPTAHASNHANGGSDEVSIDWSQITTGVPTTFTPSTHATAHKSGGGDAIKIDELAAPTDVATLNVSTTAHGLAPKLPNDAAKYLNGVGGYTVPPDTVGGGEANTQTSQGTGEGVLAMAKSGVNLPIKSIKQGTNITVTNNANDVTISASGSAGEANTQTSQGTGEGVLAMAKNVLDLPIKSLKQGANITLTNNANDVTIAAAAGTTPPDASETVKGIVELATSIEVTAGLAVQASDTRLSDARTPTAHTHAGTDITSGTVPVAQLPVASESAKGIAELATSAETTAGLVVQANDTRLSNTRAPTAHASNHANGGSDEVSVDWSQITTGVPTTFAPAAHATAHKSGGGDAVKLDELAAPTDVATLDASTTAHGLLKKLSNVSTEYMNGIGNWATPPGGYTEAKGTSTQSGNAAGMTFTIAHGLGGTPTSVLIDPLFADAVDNFTRTVDATNITLTYSFPPPSGTNNLKWWWRCAL